MVAGWKRLLERNNANMIEGTLRYVPANLAHSTAAERRLAARLSWLSKTNNVVMQRSRRLTLAVHCVSICATQLCHNDAVGLFVSSTMC